MKRINLILTAFMLLTFSVSNIFAVSVAAENSTSKSAALSLDIENDVRWFGRTYVKDGKHFFNWSASGFEFSFKGSGATAKIASSFPNSSNKAYIKIYIDGIEQKDVSIIGTTQTVTLAKNLDPQKEHTVRVIKRTNARSSSTALVSLTLTDGEKLAPPEKKERLIEFIGDSVTVGYSTVAGNSTTWSTSTEDTTKTYVTQIADAFDADYTVTAISGRGIVLNTDGSNTLLFSEIYPALDIYNNPGVEYDFSEQPELIVINLGTNDANNPSLTSYEFRVGLKAFLKMVREKNPNAEILYAYGILSTGFTEDMRAVISELNGEGDDKISFMTLSPCTSGEKSIGHPKASAYVSRGEAMIEKISELTGWQEIDDEPSTTPPDTENDKKPSQAEAEAPQTDTGTDTEGNSVSTENNSGKGNGDLLFVGIASAAAVILTAIICAIFIAIELKKRKTS